jgi:hypothetical protein
MTLSHWPMMLGAFTLAACASAEVTPRIMVTGDVEGRLMTMAEYARSEHAMPAIDPLSIEAGATPELDGSLGNRGAAIEDKAIDVGGSDATAPDNMASDAMASDSGAR